MTQRRARLAFLGLVVLFALVACSSSEKKPAAPAKPPAGPVATRRKPTTAECDALARRIAELQLDVEGVTSPRIRARVIAEVSAGAIEHSHCGLEEVDESTLHCSLAAMSLDEMNRCGGARSQAQAQAQAHVPAVADAGAEDAAIEEAAVEVDAAVPPTSADCAALGQRLVDLQFAETPMAEGKERRQLEKTIRASAQWRDGQCGNYRVHSAQIACIISASTRAEANRCSGGKD